MGANPFVLLNMGNSFSTHELKTQIAHDLKIDVAFPFFPAGRNQGSAACCVVDTEWIEKLSSKKDDEELVILKSPAYARHALSPDGNPQKQLPTVNIYVNMLPKDPSKRSDIQLYQSNSNLEKKGKEQCGWPLINYLRSLLEGKDADQRIGGLVDSFEDFESIFGESLSIEKTHQQFVNRIQKMLWPCSRRYKVIPREEDGADQLALQEMSEDSLVGALGEPLEATKPLYNDPANSNLPDVFAIIESENAYYFLASYRGTTLQDLITYNPGVLSSNFKKGFVVYQLLRAVASLHSRGILHGRQVLRASNILVDENLWTQLAGMECGANPMDIGLLKTVKIDIDSLVHNAREPTLTKDVKEEPLVIKWVRGEISNYSYIMALNHLAGRKEGDPNFHPILPWVVDFTGTSVEDGWRDFTKTKFRMNKGDEQLDFTFDGPVPHHITDILSDITYYVYLARRTPIPVLCQFVRSKYEPNEYPSSMHRLYEWTPDECIPEFYTGT
ncbi:hypothetical protein PHYBLDRAFT_175602 [Phycomyces blakesleeanus NRRL 1555(-)]|uniref:BEACH domain-containing protein n=1 Tax=Phycomyces blakesleeanus (strain ATCC 8743b / DSM 1359 / FGSC 10004 / NBRC 33097 / NRRL 1555) TaxID=763407 RepID=A0A167JJ36_PHYB8|nr:hypothetical protein PHYBLDRAFT_175602 [Phycomyces blakesleeanus NRRL 1555(-)]OAD66079.1 hypothetical protein PHYBLDRAFT_175602 [Phycomyces blakesleeanus NRRL 1555(-)]|eukprot:XP_018284119.1 hypothetical protein PHYBLDRAFT_175602 [Phycomyces blakesleeanus NRRL 1555(-)]